MQDPSSTPIVNPSGAPVSPAAGIPCDRVTLREVLAALALSERARRACLDRFRELGGQLDRVDAHRLDRVRMCDALLVAEDAIERTDAGRPRPYDAPDRHALRHVRRRLESELWP